MNSPDQFPSFSGSLFFSYQQEQDSPFIPYWPNHPISTHQSLTNSCRHDTPNKPPQFKKTNHPEGHRPKGTQAKLEYLRTPKTQPAFEFTNCFIKKQQSCYFEPLDTSLKMSGQQEINQHWEGNPEINKKQINPSHNQDNLNKTLRCTSSQPLLRTPFKSDSFRFTFNLESTESEQAETDRANTPQNQQLIKPPCLHNSPHDSPVDLLKLQLSEQLLQKQSKYRQLIRSMSKQQNPLYKQFLKTRMRTLLDELYSIKKQLQQH